MRGAPHGRTDLIREGVLAGLLTNWYETQRLLRDPLARAKLGVGPAPGRRRARGAQRLSIRRGRRPEFDTPPGTAATNVVVEGRDGVVARGALRRVGDGLCVGRIWYTYPINGLRAGDFTCTVIGDSLIRDDRFVARSSANALRISDNLSRLLAAILGVTRRPRAPWCGPVDEVVYAP